MHNLRDEEILIQQSKETPTPRLQDMTTGHPAQDCQFYGHSWQAVSKADAKCCTVCGITGYCPGCTPVSPTTAAQPFYCTKHTPRRNEEVQA